MAAATTVAGVGSVPASDLHGRPPLVERAVRVSLFACGAVTVGTTLGILWVLGTGAAQFFAEVSLFDFLGGTQWTPLFADARFGVWPLVAGTVLTAGVALSVAAPLGLLAAIYLAEYASPRVASILKPLLEILAGVPTVVYGYFALLVITPVLQAVLPDLATFNALGAGIVMGLMIVPMIASLGEDAITAVPRSLREGAYALGAGQLRTLFLVVLPAARSGLLAAVTLAVSRAIGETMIVAIAAGQQPQFTADPRVPVETMTAFIVQISMGDTPQGTLAYHTIFAVGATLFVFTFVMNAAAQWLASGARRAG